MKFYAMHPNNAAKIKQFSAQHPIVGFFGGLPIRENANIPEFEDKQIPNPHWLYRWFRIGRKTLTRRKAVVYEFDVDDPLEEAMRTGRFHPANQPSTQGSGNHDSI